MKLSKVQRMMMLVVLILASGVFASCAKNNVILNPIDKEDIFIMKSGETYVAPRDGVFLSDMYVDEIAQIKIEK